MSEEGTPTARQGLGVWIMSGSMALVMVIGGALAVNSADKSVEEGNPTATQTVAPGGGHILDEADEADEDAADESGIDGMGVAGVLSAKLTDAGLASSVSSNQPIPPVFDSREPARPSAYRTPDPTPRAGVLSTTAPAGRTESRPQPADPVPTASGVDHVDGRIATLLPSQVEVLRSDTGEALQFGFAVPGVPGNYAFTVPVDGVPFRVQVCVGEGGRVTVGSFDGHAQPYRYDAANGRLTATLAPAEFEYVAPTSAADARIETTRRIKTTRMMPGAATGSQVERARNADTPRGAEIDEASGRNYVERDEGSERGSAEATGTASRPPSVEENSPARATSTATSSTTPFTDAQTKAASQPEPTVIGATQNQDNEVEKEQPWRESTPTGTKLSTRPAPSVQARPTKAERRSTVTMSEAAGNVLMTDTPAP